MNPQSVTIRCLADEEGCSIRTVYRDIDALEAAGFPIFPENVNGTVRYKFMEGFKTKFPYPFTPTELMSLYRDEETVPKVDPYKLWFMDGSIYLIGYCHNREEFRTFLLDRIKDLGVTDRRFIPRDDFSFEEYIGDTFKVFREKELVEVMVVEFNKSIKQPIREKIWHPSQVIKDNSDGSIRVTFRVAAITEIKHWLLGFGAKAKVLEPANLREEISNEARGFLDHYKPVPKKRPMAQAPHQTQATSQSPVPTQVEVALREGKKAGFGKKFNFIDDPLTIDANKKICRIA